MKKEDKESRYLIVAPARNVRDVQVATEDCAEHFDDDKWIDVDAEAVLGIIEADSEDEAINVYADTHKHDKSAIRAYRLHDEEKKWLS